MLSERIKGRLTLSKMVAYLNTLNNLDSESLIAEIEMNLTIMFSSLDETLIDWKNLRDLQSIKSDLESKIDSINNLVDNLKKEVQKEINLAETAYYEKNDYINETSKIESISTILNRSVELTEETEKQFLEDIKTACDWRFPGVIFRPGLGKYVKSAVSLDPLYLVDVDYDLLTPSIEQFNPRYQKRLRRIVIDETMDEDILTSKLPIGQAGLVLILDFFEYKNLNTIHDYLNECFKILRPGGTLIFTFNDCTQSDAVVLVENGTRAYTPATKIRELVQDAGFKINSLQNKEKSFSWIEAVKPGKLSTLRGGQTLAKVVKKGT